MKLLILKLMAKYKDNPFVVTMISVMLASLALTVLAIVVTDPIVNEIETKGLKSIVDGLWCGDKGCD